ncbi:hypothetical protein J6590_006364 [Homalodisca vitripennis]|nr:hypothetical protein J6590_006364 [Homalodisca vitripennis]
MNTWRGDVTGKKNKETPTWLRQLVQPIHGNSSPERSQSYNVRAIGEKGAFESTRLEWTVTRRLVGHVLLEGKHVLLFNVCPPVLQAFENYVQSITDLIRDLTSIQHLIRENEAVSVAETCSLNEVVLSQANKHRTQGRYKHCSTVLGGRLYDDTTNTQLLSGVTLSPIPNLDRSEVNWVIGEDWSFVGKPATPNNQLRSGVTLSPIPNLDRSEVNWVIGEDWSFVGKPATPNNQLVVRRDKHW